jgi:hypothetical protein
VRVAVPGNMRREPYLQERHGWQVCFLTSRMCGAGGLTISSFLGKLDISTYPIALRSEGERTYGD